MKLLRFVENGQEQPGILDTKNRIRNLSAIISDFDARTLNQADLITRLHALEVDSLPLIKTSPRIGSCIEMSGKIICIGYNSHLHTQQMEIKAMQKGEMVVFLKPTSAAVGPNDPILYGKHTSKLDWEAELGVVIGKQGKYIDPMQAEDYILGYTCINDISERYWQFETEDKQYTKGKGMDSFAPIGPYLVTKDEITDATNLNVKLWVNDELRQDFNTSDYINNPAAVVSYLSQFFTLYPGDIIAMGSAPGNARFWGEDKYLKPDDKVTFEIEGLGRQQQLVVTEDYPH